MPILNRERFPDVDFLTEDQIRIIGTVGDDPLALIGFEQGTEAPVVAVATSPNPASEDLDPMPLYELLAHSYDPIVIPEPIRRG